MKNCLRNLLTTVFGQCSKKAFFKSKIVLLRSLNIFGTKNNSVFLNGYFNTLLQIKNCFSHQMVPLGTFK